MKLIAIGSVMLLLAFSAWAGTFLETFDKINLNAWQEMLPRDAVPGSWEIIKGELHAVSPDGWARFLTIGDETWDNYTIEFDVKPLNKQGPSNIAIAARITGDWAVWCLIGDHPFPNNISRPMYAVGNFRKHNPLFFIGGEPHRFLKLKKWSKLKLSVEENVLNFWINDKHVIGPMNLPNRQTFERFEVVKKQHREREAAEKGEDPVEVPPAPLGDFENFLTGGAGFGLSNQEAIFDNIKITGARIPNSPELSVTPSAKLATVWGHLKQHR